MAEKVALSLVLLGLLRAYAVLWGTTLYRYPGPPCPVLGGSTGQWYFILGFCAGFPPFSLLFTDFPIFNF